MYKKTCLLVGSRRATVGDVQVLRQWLVVCCHGNCLLQPPIWTELKHSGNLLNMWLLGKRNSVQSLALQGQLLPCQLPLLNLHQTCVLCVDKGHTVGSWLYSNKATLPVHRLSGLCVEGIEHKVDDWLSHVGEVQCLYVAERLNGGKAALARLF